MGAIEDLQAAGKVRGWADAMGIVVLKQSVEGVVAELSISDLHRQAFGLVHGGVYCGLIETAASLGAWLVAHARGQSVVGVEHSVSFIRAAKSGTLRAAAKPVTRGRKSQVWEVTVCNGADISAVGRVRLLCLDSVPASRSVDQ
jgi:1,4-dihydroxy-2-naphthoyl-CoA hydrolase